MAIATTSDIQTTGFDKSQNNKRKKKELKWHGMKIEKSVAIFILWDYRKTLSIVDKTTSL